MKRGLILVVGMPRSGTKLLRTLLNNNPDVAIPNFETEFLPHWIRHWEEFGDLRSFSVFENFYQNQLGLPFFLYAGASDNFWSAREWHDSCADFTVSGVFEGLLRCATGTPLGATTRLGDKSPSYLFHVDMLATAFTGPCIVHIIRDVRDVALSAKRAWGKTMERTADRWCGGMAVANGYRNRTDLNYREVRYEDLIHAPEYELEKLCCWLEIPYCKTMLDGLEGVENLGEAAGADRIVAHNRGKFRECLSSRQRQEIERIAGSILMQLGYKDVQITGNRRLGKWRSGLLQIVDGINLLCRSMMRNGPLGGLRMTIGFRRLVR